MTDYILVAGAVSAELAPLRKELKKGEESRVGGRSVVWGEIGDWAVRLIETGPGLVNTAQSLTAMLETIPPRLVLMVGCAGGFKQAGMAIGDLGIATDEIDAQLGIEPGGKDIAPAPLPFNLGRIGGKYIKHRVEMAAALTTYAEKLICQEFTTQNATVIQGPFITVSTITSTDHRAELLFKQFQPCMESMEGVAGAYVAGYYGIPFLEIRSASNIVGNRRREAWNVPLACQRSGSAAISFIRESKEGWPA